MKRIWIWLALLAAVAAFGLFPAQGTDAADLQPAQLLLVEASGGTLRLETDQGSVGFAENSIIFREVEIEEGAEVRDCVVMQGAKIGAGANIQYAILDKNVVVRPGTRLLGTPEHPLIINKGAIV